MAKFKIAPQGLDRDQFLDFDLTTLDLLAWLDTNAEAVADEKSAALALQHLSGDISHKQALEIIRIWNDNLTRDPRPNWSDIYFLAISENEK